MKNRTLFVALMLMLAVAGCKSGSTPTATFKAFFEAQQKKDVAGMKKNLSKTSLAIMEKSAKEQNKSIDDAIKEFKTAPQYGNKKPHVWHFEAMKRILDRKEPDYKN